MVNGALTGAAAMADVMSFQTPAVLISVVLLGKYVECVARGATARSIQALSALRAPTARLVRGAGDADGGGETDAQPRNSSDSSGSGSGSGSGGDSGGGDRVIDASLLQVRPCPRPSPSPRSLTPLPHPT